MNKCESSEDTFSDEGVPVYLNIKTTQGGFIHFLNSKVERQSADDERSEATVKLTIKNI